MNYMYAFEKLQVWHDSRALVGKIYAVTEQIPGAEKYGLTSRMRRAAVSVVSNIAEGTGRTSPKDQAHFYQLAYSSIIELLNQLIISKDLSYIKESELATVREIIEMISNKLNALRNSSLKRINK